MRPVVDAGSAIATQLALIAAIVALGSIDPAATPVATATVALTVAFCSASQEHRRSTQDRGRRDGQLRLAIASRCRGDVRSRTILQGGGLEGWFAGYAIAASLVAIGMVTVLLSREPDGPEGPDEPKRAGRAQERGVFPAAMIDPFREFITRPMWLAVLLFVMLFKFGDAFAGIMTAPFVLDIGFDKTDYGRIVKLFGLIAVLLGGFTGGYVYRVAGVVRSLWIAGIIQMLSNLMFVLQAYTGADYVLLVLTIGVENFTGGIGTVIFVAFISGLCRDRAYTATQFALLTALSAVGRTVLSASAGWFAENIGWPSFFLLTTAAAVPGLLLLWWLVRVGAIAAAPVGPRASAPASRHRA